MKIIKIKESELVHLVKSVIEEKELTNEQLLKGLGDKIKSGVNKVAQKVADITKPQAIAEPKKETGRDFNQIRAEWSKINSDMSNMNGFGEAIGMYEHSIHSEARIDAVAAIMKKMNKQEATFGSEIVDEALFKLPNGNYHQMIILKPTNIK